MAIDGFGRAIDPFLAVAAGDPTEQPLTVAEFERVSQGPAKALWARAPERLPQRNRDTLRLGTLADGHPERSDV